MRRNVVAVLILFAGIALACGTGRKGSAGFRLPDGDPAKGREAFVANRCYACHVVNGVELGTPFAEGVPIRLGGSVPTLPTDGQLATAILSPSHRLTRGPGNAVRSGKLSRMGDFTESMTLREMIDIVAFLQPTYKEQRPPVYH
jgi:hypothetical protein